MTLPRERPPRGAASRHCLGSAFPRHCFEALPQERLPEALPRGTASGAPSRGTASRHCLGSAFPRHCLEALPQERLPEALPRGTASGEASPEALPRGTASGALSRRSASRHCFGTASQPIRRKGMESPAQRVSGDSTRPAAIKRPSNLAENGSENPETAWDNIGITLSQCYPNVIPMLSQAVSGFSEPFGRKWLGKPRDGLG